MKTSGIFRSVIIFAFLMVLLSCSNTIPQVVRLRAMLLFDFSQGSSAQQRLSVFVEPSSDIARISEITIEHPKSGLLWKLSEPDFISLDKGTWAGSAHLVMQNPQNFPLGDYRLTLADYNGKSAISAFTLEYPERLTRASVSSVEKASNYPELLRRFVILYDDNSEILSIGSESGDNTDSQRIKKRFPTALFTQTYIETDKKNYAVLLPMHSLKETSENLSF